MQLRKVKSQLGCCWSEVFLWLFGFGFCVAQTQEHHAEKVTLLQSELASNRLQSFLQRQSED